MKFIQTGTFKKDFLEKSTTIKPLESIDKMFLEKFDYFIEFITREKPAIISDYIGNLTKKYQGLVEEDFLINSSKEIQKIYSKFNNLTQYPELTKTSLKYFIHLLQIKNKKIQEMEEVQISMKALIQAWTYPSYYFLQALTETIDREEAVKLFKRFITHYYIDHPSPNREKFVSLEKRLEDRLSGDTSASEWVMVHTMLGEGKHAFKNLNCPTCADTMTELPDVELKYLVACYGDYAKFRANLNDHIVLTMEHTIVQGDPYCSRVLHDTRVDWDLTHPPKEFWDNFTPGKEKEAKKYYKK